MRDSEAGTCALEDAERGANATEDAGGLFLGGAEPEQVFQRSTITPVVAEPAESIELALAHETDEDEPAPDGVVPDSHAKICREFQTWGEVVHRDKVFHWCLRIP